MTRFVPQIVPLLPPPPQLSLMGQDSPQEYLHVRCSNCGAKPHEKCVSRYGNMVPYAHAARVSDATSESYALRSAQEARAAIMRRRADPRSDL